MQMEKEQKIEGMALWHKDLLAEAAAIRAEEVNLAARRKTCESKAERLKSYLAELLGGNKFKTPRVVCSYRTSAAVEIADEAEFVKRMQEGQHFEYLSFKAPTVNRTAITQAIKEGKTVEGAELVKRQNISIK